MSRSRDHDRFLDALLGADPDEATPPAPEEADSGTAEGPAEIPPPTPQGRSAPRVDLQPAAATAAHSGPRATASRPAAYEAVLPVPDDPEVVAQLQERAGVVRTEPELTGFLEGLLGIVAPEPPTDVRDRLIAAYGDSDAVEPEAESVAAEDAPVVAADALLAESPEPEVEEITAPRVEGTASTDSASEDAGNVLPPPLSHDTVSEDGRAGALAGAGDDAPADQDQPLGPSEPAPDATPTDGSPAPAEPVAARAPAAVQQPAAAPPVEDAERDLVRSLTSFDVGRRRAALVALLERPLDRELTTAAASSLRDPEIGIRLLALQVLERAPELAPVEALDVTMSDPEPEIRRRAASLIGRTGDLRLLPQLQARLGEETDEDVLAAGLTAVADLFRVAGERADTSDLDRVSATVGNLRTAALPQLGRELTVLARTLDAGEIRHRLGDVDEAVRVGAAVLALESGSEDSLRALARLVTDGSGRVRQLAMTAVARLRSDGGEPPPSVPLGDPTASPEPGPADGSAPHREGMSRAVADEVQGALLPGLLEALADPKQEIRDQARNALALVDRDRLVAYVEEQARQADADELVRLISASQRLGLDETVPGLAAAALRHAGSRASGRLAEALQDIPTLGGLLDGWRTSDAPESRADALRLATLVGTDPTAAVLAGLSDPNPNVRLVGVETARGRLDDRLAAALLGLIESDPSTRVQVAALEAFRDAPAHERAAAARAAAGSPVAEVRRHALELLSPRASEDFNQLAAALRDEDHDVVETAARLLSSGGGPEATALLWSEIRGVAADTRHLLLEVLRAEQPEALARLAHRAIESMDPAERAGGLAALAMLGDATVRDQLVASLGDPSVDVRLEALHALAVEPGAVGTAPLAAVMRDADPRVRARAVDVIAGTEDEDAVPLLVRALDDPAEAVRLATRRALGRVRSPAAVDLLLEALGRPAHRAAAVDALAALGQPATGRLVRALASSTGEVREAVREALIRSGAVERTVASLRDPRPARRRAALTLLRAIRPDGISGAVAERLEDPDPEVRQHAAQLLGELGDRAVVPALQHAFVNDPDMDVVAAVETAYRRLGGGEAS